VFRTVLALAAPSPPARAALYAALEMRQQRLFVIPPPGLPRFLRYGRLQLDAQSPIK
jgi:hypothetical protein